MHVKFQMFETKQVQSNELKNSILNVIIGELMYAISMLFFICENKVH